MNRRTFIENSAIGIATTLATPNWIFAESLGANPKVKWGIALIPWGDSYLKGIEEISTLGVHGVQIRNNAFNAFKEKPLELKNLCKKLEIEIPIMSGGDVNPDPKERGLLLAQFEDRAKFLKSLGGKFIQATTFKRDSFPPGKDKLLELAQTLNLVGETVKKHGIELLLHNHMHQLCQTPEELSFILDSTDPKKVGLLLDVAHYAQAGGNPSEAIIKYKKRLKLLHIKDLLSPKPNHQGPNVYNYQFVELGKGNKIHLNEILTALKEIRFKDWCMIELDAVPNPKETALEASRTSIEYLKANFGYKFG